MRRSLLLVLVAVAVGAGCAEPVEKGAELPSATAPDPSTPATAAPERGRSGAGSPTSTVAAGGEAVCVPLKVIADADLELSSTVPRDQVTAMVRDWPRVAAAYDDAIARAPAAMAADLRTIKEFSQMVMDQVADADDFAAVMLDLVETHRSEIVAVGGASLRAEQFTEDRCGFSLNNE